MGLELGLGSGLAWRGCVGRIRVGAGRRRPRTLRARELAHARRHRHRRRRACFPPLPPLARLEPDDGGRGGICWICLCIGGVCRGICRGV